MAVNVFQVNEFMTHLIDSLSSAGDVKAGAYASEFPLAPDNINGQLSRYAKIMGIWTSCDLSGGGAFDLGNGSTYYAWRAPNSFYVRGTWTVNELGYYGYVGSFVGGYFNQDYTHDPNGSSVDYEPIYGHGVASWPQSNSNAIQFRDSNSLPQDGSCVIGSTGSNYSRSRYMPPAYHVFHITNGGTIGSGNLGFIMSTRPTTLMTGSNRCKSPLWMSQYEYFQQSGVRKLNSRAHSVFVGRIMSGNYNKSYPWRYEEDNSDAGNYTLYDAHTVAEFPTSRPSGDFRIRHHAMFYINPEYYGMVQESKLAIYSNKATFLPLVFVDLADTWGTAAGFRIAGVSVSGDDTTGYKIYILSEAGALAVYDFTQTDGVLTALTSAPAPDAGDSYGACKIVGTTLYAMVGNMAVDPRNTTTGTAHVGVIAYDITGGTWGAASFSPVAARHNAHSLHEMIALRDGRLALLVEDVAVNGANITNANSAADVGWQFMLFDPSNSTWNASKVNGFLYDLSDLSYWQFNIGGSITEVKAGKVLLQANWKNNKVWIVDVSGSAATLSTSNVLNVGKGSAADIFPTAATAGAITAIRKSVTHDRVMMHQSVVDKCTGDNNSPSVYLAGPGFAWDGSAKMQVLGSNAHNSSDWPSITTIDKDKTWMPQMTAGGWYSTNYMGEWSLWGFFVDNYIGFLPCAVVPYNNSVGEDGLSWTSSNSGNLYWKYMAQSLIFVPTYYCQKAGQVTLADNWADAAANPIPVPAVAGTTINVPYGLKIQFGPAAGTTYNTGEFHTFNVAWGNVKYARKARYMWAMFAGQTYFDTNTKALTDIKAIVPRIHNLGAATYSFTGPNSITNPTDGHRMRALYPKIYNGDVNDAPVVMELTISHPDAGSIINVPGDGKVLNASSVQSNDNANYGVALAFNGNPATYWRPSNPSNAWASIDLGVGTVVNSYSFRVLTDNGTVSAFKLQGSNDNSAWTDVDVRTSQPTVRTFAFNVTTPASFRYYRLLLTGVTSYPSVGSIRLYSGNLVNTMDFSEIIPNGCAYQRGYTFEVDNGTGYQVITPKWRSHMGTAFCFDRQTAVQKVRITVQYGYSHDDANLAVGPFHFVDYGTQVQMNAARLGSIAAQDGTAARGSYDSQCLGVACDVATISVDGDAANLRSPAYSPDPIGDFYNFWSLGANKYKMHPYWGFLFLPGGGAGDQPAAGASQTGTNVSIMYHWGRRV